MTPIKETETTGRSLRFLLIALVMFFASLCAYPTIRLLTIGSDHASSVLAALIAFLPELFLAVILIVAGKNYFSGARNPWSKLDAFVLVYIVLVVLIGFALSGNLRTGLASFRITYLPMSLYFVASLIRFDSKDLLRLLHQLMIVVTALGAIGFVLYFLFPDTQKHLQSLASPMPQAAYFIVRMTSLFYTPVVFGVCMMTIFFYWGLRYVRFGDPSNLIGMVIGITAVFFSVSRGPIIGAVLGGIVIALLTKAWKRIGVVLLLVLLAYCGVGFYAADPLTFGHWLLTSTGNTMMLNDDETRVSLWLETWQTMQSHPFGLGLGNAGHVAAQSFPKGTPGVSRTSTDGWYFKQIVETGIQSMVLYLILLIWIIRIFVRQLRAEKTFFAIFFLAVFAAVGLINIVSNTLDFYFFAYLYWFLLGIFIHLEKERTNA